MVSKVFTLGLRGFEFFCTLLIMALIGNMIASARAGNPSIVNYDMFVAVLGMLSLIYLILASVKEAFAIHPGLPLLVDGLNTLFYFIGAVATAAKLGVHSCSNSHYTKTNSVTNGSADTKGRCQEAQASTAFLFFAFFAFIASTLFSFLGARSSGGVNLRSGGLRKGAPSMSQV